MTLKLQAAADVLGMHPQTVQERARAGKIPGASKPGRRWVFQEAGLLAYLNQHSPCPFTGEVESGGSSSPRTAGELESLLGLPTRSKRRHSTKRGAGRYGGR